MFTNIRAKESIPALDSKAAGALREACFDEMAAILAGLPTDNHEVFMLGIARHEALHDLMIAAHSACLYAIDHHL